MSYPAFFNLINYSEPELYNFQIGYIAGVVIVLVLFLLAILLIYFYRRNHRIKGISVPGDNGSLFIAAGAIYDYIKVKVSEVDTIHFSKVSLTRNNQRFSLEIQVDFDVNTQALPAMIESMRTNIMAGLKGVFGITDIEEINVKVKRAKIQ